jgi:hypothetical protein
MVLDLREEGVRMSVVGVVSPPHQHNPFSLYDIFIFIHYMPDIYFLKETTKNSLCTEE